MWFILQPRRRRNQLSPKHQHLSAGLQSVTSQKTVNLAGLLESKSLRKCHLRRATEKNYGNPVSTVGCRDEFSTPHLLHSSAYHSMATFGAVGWLGAWIIRHAYDRHTNCRYLRFKLFSDKQIPSSVQTFLRKRKFTCIM
jgi:hypothetical protein